MAKIISKESAVELIRDSDRVMVGGFLAVGAPTDLIDSLVSSTKKELTLIVIATDFPDRGVGKLITAKKIKRVITSHIGTNPLTQEQYKKNEIEIEFVPQGTLAERIRAAGAGLGGILTPTGIGTDVANGKEIKLIDGKEYLLEKALAADVALVCAKSADSFGNLIYEKSARNLNPLIAQAAKITIAEVDEYFATPFEAEAVVTPGIYVDYIVVKEKR